MKFESCLPCSLLGALKLVSRSEDPMSPTTNSNRSHTKAVILFSKHLLIITRHQGFRSSAQYRLMKVTNCTKSFSLYIGIVPGYWCYPTGQV